MGGRYFISGVQLGMVKAFADMGEIEEIDKLIEKIINGQYIKRSKFDELKIDDDNIISA